MINKFTLRFISPHIQSDFDKRQHKTEISISIFYNIYNLLNSMHGYLKQKKEIGDSQNKLLYYFIF